MKVTFWGTRGSIPTPGARTSVYGGNTSCVEIRCGRDILIFDAGTGIRELGLALLNEFLGEPLTLHLFISHTHWDHIQGFPFFVPAYEATTTLHIYGSPGQGRPLEKLLVGQMDPDYFPVGFGDLESSLRVHEFRGGDFRVGDASITAMYLNHPGMCLAYKVTHGGKTVVYATDHEPYRQTLPAVGRRGQEGAELGQVLDEELVRFVSGVDLYIGEAQYTDDEYRGRVGWGHSSLSATVGVALRGAVKSLALFHHDPMHTDEIVAEMLDKATRLIDGEQSAVRCFAASEGLSIEV
jgi:phosphoribosyl 1,2-cyclic phosphodiesterase